MNRPLALLIATTAFAAVVAACSADPGSSSIYGAHSKGPGGSTTTGSGNSSSGDDTGSNPGTSNPSTGGSSATPTQPPPAAGPGSSGSSAHQYFEANVYPLLAVCQGCHASGTDGAPVMMQAPAATTYQELDARGLIQTNSLLETHGSHDSGKAPALTAAQLTPIGNWLSMEATERAGQAAPVNVLDQIGNCIDQGLFDSINFQDLRTQPRNNENPNRCTGCDNAPCQECHAGGEAGFWMSQGSNLVSKDDTFTHMKVQPYILKYFGLNGTTPVASNAIMTKMQAVGAGPAYSHPMFVMPQTMQDALGVFVSNAISKYTATGGKCSTASGPADAGTD